MKLPAQEYQHAFNADKETGRCTECDRSEHNILHTRILLHPYDPSAPLTVEERQRQRTVYAERQNIARDLQIAINAGRIPAEASVAALIKWLEQKIAAP